jgi:hypothetical protein
MRALALAGALLALALPLAGCGASGSSNASRATPQSAPTGQPPQIDRQAFSKLRTPRPAGARATTDAGREDAEGDSGVQPIPPLAAARRIQWLNRAE